MEPVNRNIYQRMLAVMEDVSFIAKDKKNAFLKFDYASHDNVTASIRPYLIKHRIGLVFDETEYSVRDMPNDKGFMTTIVATISFVNADNPEDRIVVRSLGQGIDKNDLGPGKAKSYAYKTALLKAFALETGIDNEESAGSDAHPGKPAKNTAPAKPAPAANKPASATTPDSTVNGNGNGKNDVDLMKRFKDATSRMFTRANLELEKHGLPQTATLSEFHAVMLEFLGPLTANKVGGIEQRSDDAIGGLVKFLQRKMATDGARK